MLERMHRNRQNVRNLVSRDVLGKLQMHRPRPLFRRDPEGIANDGRDAAGADDLPRHLGQRPHRGDDVDDLEPRLPGAHDRLLPGDHDHRHGAEMGIGRGGRKIERAGPERRDADAGPPGQPPMRRRHEAGRLLVPRDDQLDARCPQRFHDVEVFLAGHAKNPVHAFVFEGGDEEVGAFGHALRPSDSGLAAATGSCRGQSAQADDPQNVTMAARLRDSRGIGWKLPFAILAEAGGAIAMRRGGDAPG